MALTSMWAASHGTSSRSPPGQDVDDPARHVARGQDLGQRDGRQRASSRRSARPRCCPPRPPARGGDTRPSSEDDSGATTPTTPVASGMVKSKYGAATGLDVPSTWLILSAQPAYQTQRSIERSTCSRPRAGPPALRRPRPRPRTGRGGPPAAPPRGTGPGPGSWPSWRPTGWNAYGRRGPRRGRPCASHARRWQAARPSGERTTYDRPDSERGNAPPMYSL